MYINKVDRLIDVIIDDFFSRIVNKDKTFAKIVIELNFVKYQLEINSIIADYVKSIDVEEIRKVVNNDDNVIKIISIIKRYIAYYTLLTIGVSQSGKNDTYVNNIIEFTKNQGTFNFKIDNFFNAENNSILIKFYQIAKNTQLFLELEESKLQIYAKKPEFRDTIVFLNELGQEIVMSSFKLENIKGDAKIQTHNIVKTLIFQELYMKTEKKDVYDILLSIEKETGEFTFIDVVVPKSFYIDFTAIENLLDERESRAGVAADIYEFIQKTDDISRRVDTSPEEKLSILIDSKLIIPVVDDFLMYHKESERYEKVIGMVEKDKKKKEDTKIRYIVNKLDSVSDLYAESIKKNPTALKNIEKLFYIPLSDRKATLINDYEEIKIINKLLNQGKRSIENNEFYNDLLSYREYAYANFKDFNEDGFTLQGDKTVTIARYTSFENIKRGNNPIQLRVVNRGGYINIVGMIVTDGKVPIECIKMTQFRDIKSHGKKKIENGYSATIKLFKNVLLSNKKYTPFFWKFNSKHDSATIDSYQQVSKMNQYESIKLTVSRLYDDVIQIVYSTILDKLDEKKSITVYDGLQMVRTIEKKLFSIPKGEIIDNLHKAIFYDNSERTENKYDKKEDTFGGLFENVVKLPIYKKTIIKKSNTVSIEQDFIIEGDIDIDKTEAEKVGAICQHFISWDNIMAIKKKHPNQYTDLLYEFINQYVLENNDGDYVCKSCSTQLNIKKFITDGYYDRGTDKFTTFTMPLTVFLEEIPEYEKFRITIRNLDKLVEKISSVSNIPYYVGAATSVKTRRKPIVKNVIDLMLKHNKILTKYYKQRHEKIDTTYGVLKNLTNLFIFELDNSIFLYSSKDKDYYKPIKHNNILIYTMFMILIELSDSQILFMNGDKTCNFFWFDKYGHYYFDNLKIIVNDKGDTLPIKKFPILCYTVYFMACLITKYKMWYFESKDNTLTKKKLVPLITRSIINTFVDIANSILEVNKRDKKDFLYTLICNRFFLSLNTVFNNKDLVQKMSRSDDDKTSALIHSKKYILTKLEPILLPGQYTNCHLHTHHYNKYPFARMCPKMRPYNKLEYLTFNNFTNCLSGTFHVWEADSGNLKCSVCGRIMKQIKQSGAENDTVAQNLYILKLKKMATKYCLSGELHKFVYDSKKDMNVCTRCGYDVTKEISVTELRQMEKNVDKLKSVKLMPIGKRTEFQIERFTSVEGIRKQVQKNGLDKLIEQFIDTVQSNIGQEVILNGQKIFLKQDSFIINHTPKGQYLDDPIIITDKSKIIYRKQHPFFKKDVLFYTNNKYAKTDVFYDASSHILLGYKEVNKEYQTLPNASRYLVIQESIANRISLLGYTNRFVPIHNDIENLKDKYPDMQDNDIIRTIISEINRKRIAVLKKTITDFQRYIYRLAYNYDENEGDDYHDEPTRDYFMKKYYKKLTKIRLNSDKNDKVFDAWEDIDNGVYYNLPEDVVINLNIKDRTVSTDELKRVDENGNIVLYFILQELMKLLELNPSKFIKANLVYFMLDALNNVYEFYNNDTIFKNNDIRRFMYLLATDKFIHDTQEQYMVSKPEGFYGEYSDIDDVEDPEKEEEKYDDDEEQNAIDIETTNYEVADGDDDAMILDPDNFESQD